MTRIVVFHVVYHILFRIKFIRAHLLNHHPKEQELIRRQSLRIDKRVKTVQIRGNYRQQVRNSAVKRCREIPKGVLMYNKKECMKFIPIKTIEKWSGKIHTSLKKHLWATSLHQPVCPLIVKITTCDRSCRTIQSNNHCRKSLSTHTWIDSRPKAVVKLKPISLSRLTR